MYVCIYVYMYICIYVYIYIYIYICICIWQWDVALAASTAKRFNSASARAEGLFCKITNMILMYDTFRNQTFHAYE